MTTVKEKLAGYSSSMRVRLVKNKAVIFDGYSFELNEKEDLLNLKCGSVGTWVMSPTSVPDESGIMYLLIEEE